MSTRLFESFNHLDSREINVTGESVMKFSKSDNERVRETHLN